MNISDFVTICRYKNGGYRFQFTPDNEANIYKKLFELGFRRSKISQKGYIFFKQEGLELTPIDINVLQRAFFEYLDASDKESFPKGFSKGEILNYYLKKMPVKKSGSLFYHLQYEISDREAHQLLLKVDFEYKHRFERDQLIQKLDQLGFTQTIDTGSLIATNRPLYFKKVGEHQYLIFTHYNSTNKKCEDGFDCWISTFKNPQDIGKKTPAQINELRLSFHLERDYSLISKYFI